MSRKLGKDVGSGAGLHSPLGDNYVDSSSEVCDDSVMPTGGAE
jgi:hypothetical protein